MRKIKFRAFDRNRRCFVNLCREPEFCDEGYYFISPENGEVVEVFNSSYDSYPSINWTGFELTQYTGLKDCKGCEIYEGDIVASVCDGEILEVGDIQFDCGVFGIEWVRTKQKKTMVGSWGQKHNLRRLDDDIIDTNNIEVIGNVYQNSELLK